MKMIVFITLFLLNANGIRVPLLAWILFGSWTLYESLLQDLWQDALKK